MNNTNVIYQFRMSAVANIEGVSVEGELSEVTAQSFTLVPKPGIVHEYTVWVCVFVWFLAGYIIFVMNKHNTVFEFVKVFLAQKI